MKKLITMLLFTILPINAAMAVANCDLSQFRWDCEIPITTKVEHGTSSLVYCGDIRGYLTPTQYDQLTRYYRRSINMVLKVNDEYVTSPCMPMRKYDRRE